METKQKNDEKGYYSVTFLDINEMLSFTKKEYKDLDKQIKEEERVEKELIRFVRKIEKYCDHKLHHIGHEKSYGTHLIRFIIEDSGFLEVIVEKPLTINAHFLSKKSAEVFVEGLKKALLDELPDSSIKEMIVNSLKVSEGFDRENFSIKTWNRLHHMVLPKTTFLSLLIVIIFTVVEAVQEFFEAVTSNVLHLQSISVSIIIALIIGVIFDPLKNFVEKIFSRIFS